MTIGVWSYLAEYEQERDDLLAAVEQVFSSGRLILGPTVAAFEREFAAWCGVKHAIGVDNGTNALVLALRAAGVEPGDEVVTVANTAAPTVVAIHAVGARALFVDIDPRTYLIDTAKLEAAITLKTKCVVAVHLYGQCVDMTVVQRVAEQHGLRVVEDCAQAHGARWNGRMAGGMSDAAAFSFYPTKVLGAYGDGGAVITNRDDVAHRVRRLRYYGMEDRYYVVEPGYNARLDEVQAEILRRKLTRIDAYISRRRRLANRYKSRLADSGLTLPVTAADADHVYYLFVVRHPGRDAILHALEKRGIRLSVSYRWPVHLMTGFDYLGYREGDLPETEAAANEIFSLPMYPSLSDETQDTVCTALGEILNELR